eukprot:363062-Chlamydomonas_euryale.AAC.14
MLTARLESHRDRQLLFFSNEGGGAGTRGMGFREASGSERGIIAAAGPGIITHGNQLNCSPSTHRTSQPAEADGRRDAAQACSWASHARTV